MDLDVDPAVATATPPRPGWFGGLQRRRPRLLGGVAAGLADFWEIDPLLVRVVLISPFLTGLLALMALPWFETYFGGLAVLGTQLIWLVAGTTATAYLAAWVFIPWQDRDSILQRVLGLEGAFGALVKLVFTVGGLLLLGWTWLALGLNLAGLGSVALILSALVAVATIGIAAAWASQHHDLRTLVSRLGTRGLGRFTSDSPVQPDQQPRDHAGQALADPGPPAPATSSEALPDEPAAVYPPGPPPPAAEHPTAAMSGLGSVDRARAAAAAAAEAQAAAADAARRERIEQRRARRVAARAERKRRNRWGWLVAAVTLIATGALVIADRVGLTDLGLLGVGLISLALLTAGIVVGAFFGSARWLVLPALLLAAALATATAATAALNQAAAAPLVTVAPAKLPTGGASPMQWDEANVTVDLTSTQHLAGNGLALSVERGSLTVIVPATQWTSITSEVVLGTNNVAQRSVRVGDVSLVDTGYDQWGPVPEEPDYADALSLYLHVGIGELTVVQKES